MSEDQVRREFNRWADEGRGRGMEEGHWEITRLTIELMGVRQEDNIFDLGCGSGWASRVLAGMAPKGVIVGADLADHMIREAVGEYPNPPNTFFLVADAAGIPCRDACFDSLLSVESIYYYPDLETTFGEVCRILRPGGCAYLLINYFKENPYSHVWSKYLNIPVHLLGADDYKKLLGRAGFSEVSHRQISDPTPIPDDFKPSRWHPSRKDLEGFQAAGALLLIAKK